MEKKTQFWETKERWVITDLMNPQKLKPRLISEYQRCQELEALDISEVRGAYKDKSRTIF